jgi:predicted neutral ceramidase superfamily lipid hydrolase
MAEYDRRRHPGASSSSNIVWLVKESPVMFRVRATALVAAVFWMWAAWKVVTISDHDYGVVSFAAVVIACEVVSCWVGPPPSPTMASLQQMCLAGSTGLVTANYLFVLLTIPSLPWTFQLYLAVGATYWTAIGFWNSHAFRHEIRDETATALLSHE